MGRQHAAAGILFVLLALLLTWPLARNVSTAVADPGDPYINTWILDWDLWATLRQPLGLFHANAFHPAEYSLAFSENLYAIAVLVSPLRAIGVPPLAAHNVAMLLGFALCGFAMYLLALRLTGSWIAAIAAGIFYAFLPWRFVHLAHLQHVWGGWLPLLLLALIAYIDAPTRKRAALFALVFVLNGLTNIHYFFFGSLAVFVTFLFFRERWRMLAVATSIGGVVLAPFFYPYAVVAKKYGMQRTWEEVLRFSALPREWFVTGEQSRLYAWLFDASVDPERRLFPGFLVLGLAAIGVWFSSTRARGIALLWIAIGFLGSLGLNFEFHRFLFGGVPGFRAIRSPARWAVIAYIGLAILAAFAIAAVARKQKWIAAAFPILFIAELWSVPVRWFLADPTPAPVYAWLNAQPRPTPVMELPIDELPIEYDYLLRSTAHHQPIVNGVSGFAPPERVRLAAMANSAPVRPDFVDALRANRVRYVIVHADVLGQRAKETRAWVKREVERGRLGFVQRFDGGVWGDWVFEVGARRAGGEAFYENRSSRSASTFGTLDWPPSGARLHGGVTFSGFAFSPHGIAKVELLFNNGAVRIPATLHEDAPLVRQFPWYPRTTRPRFRLEFKDRPPEIRERGDVVVEITDGRGEVTRVGSRWFTWFSL